MKTIYKSLLAFAAALLLVPASHAQTRQYTLDSQSGFAVDKYVKDTNPNADGEYTLRIETFATGAVTVAKKSIPSDIVVVLDGSGSMSSNRMVHSMRVETDNTNFKYSSGFAGAVNSTYFYRYPNDATGEYCEVLHGHAKVNGSATWNHHWLYFKTSGGDTYYLYGRQTDADHGVHTDPPADGRFATEGATIWTGKLYRYPQRIEVLRSAVVGFIDKIKQNNDEEVLPYLEPGVTGNQISIVVFRGNGSPDAITDPLVGVTNPSGVTTKALIDFTPVDNEHLASLKSAARSVPASGYTPHDAGMKVAELLIENLESTMPAYVGTTQKRLRTVIFFTDGSSAISDGSRTAAQVKKSTIGYAYNLKQNYHTKIFSIGFNPSNADKTFLQYTSSNHPTGQTNDGSNFTDGDPSTVPPADERIYYMDAGTVDMDAIFDSIAQNVGGGSSSNYGNTPLLAVDMISNSFKLPEGVDLSRVKVFTAQCIGTTGNKVLDDKNVEHDELAFASAVPIKTRGDVSYWVSTPVVDAEGNPVPDELGKPTYTWEMKTEDIDENIEAEIDVTTNTVTVGGFEYEALWCGYDPEHNNQITYDPNDYPDTYKPGYRGFKIIIEFPIVVKDGALGGPTVATNYTSSGVYQTDENGDKTGLPIVEYPVPTLAIPINLWIEKRGLKPGESATFTILCKKVEPDDPNDNEYKPFGRVILTGSEDGSPVVEKLLNLSPEFFYKIWEEGWAWSYSNQAQDLESAPTTETIKKNPIVIENHYDDPDVKHAEAGKRNEMGKAESTSSPVTP